MKPQEAFYKNGYYQREFKQSEILDEILFEMKKILNREIKAGYSLIVKEKYKNSLDLRPHPYSYNDCFLDLLFEASIPSELKEITGLDLFLSLIKIRINLPGQPYTDWHRDTNFYSGKVKGNIPPIINLHMYPRFEEEEERALEVWAGSHLSMNKNYLFDRALVKITKPKPIMSSDNSYTVLDTSLIHRVPNTDYPNGAIRLMYSFCREFQLEKYQQEHRVIQEAYKNRL